MTKRFKIGVPISKLGDNSVGLTLSYLALAEQFGDPVLLLPNSPFDKDLDLLILTGGADVDSARYGEMPSYNTSKPDVHKEYFDRVMLPKYMANSTPILGICRGHQSVAVALGASLIQHMQHETNKPDDPYKSVHGIKIDLLKFWNSREFSDKTEFQVNSRHHQAVSRRNLPKEIVVLASHSVDNTIELFSHIDLPILGCQFHYEDLMDEETISLMDNMVHKMIVTRKSILKDE